MWTVSRTIAAPTDEVWQILVDLAAWPRWGPTVRDARLDGSQRLGLGVRGRIRPLVGPWVPFVVTEYQPGRSWAWQVAGIEATRHGVDATSGGCRAWMSAPWWAPGYLPVLAVALARIEAMAERRS